MKKLNKFFGLCPQNDSIVKTTSKQQTVTNHSTFQLFNHSTGKAAFTLAEVLITLAIIGVVAAITMPALIKNYQMKTYEVAFKKMYSTLQGAIDYITTTEELSQCYAYNRGGSYQIAGADCAQLYEELKKNLQVQDANKNMYKMYAKRDDVRANGGSSIHSEVNYDLFLRLTNPYMLKDGSIIYLQDLSYKAYNEAVIVFDINGKKGPNKWGYDVFWMTLTQHKSGKIRLTDELASLKEKGGRYPREILRGVSNSNNNSSYW